MVRVESLGDRDSQEQGARHDPRPDHVVNTSRVFEEDMRDVDDPKLSQSLEVEGLYAVAEHEGEFEAIPADSLVVFSDGSLYAADGSGEDLADLEGFCGYVFIRGEADALSSKQLEQMLSDSKIEMEEENNG